MLDQMELLERRIEREMNKVDAAGTYPCTVCGKRTPLETMGPLDGSPDSPLICESCENHMTIMYDDDEMELFE